VVKNLNTKEFMDTPISILIPVLNGQKYLPSFLGAISQIASPVDQIVFVNDNSSDMTFEILLDWKLTTGLDVLVLDNPGIGLVAGLNFGLANSKHDWIARFDIDDKYENNRLRIQRQEITPGTAAIFCDYQFVSAEEQALGLMPTAISSSATLLSLITGQRTPHPGVVFNKTLALAVGGYRERDFPAEDLSLWLRMGERGEIRSVPEVLLKYRISKGSVTARNRELSIARKKEFIESSSILRAAYKNSLKNLSGQIKEYSNVKDGSLRITLHYRDLFLSLKLFGNFFEFAKYFLTCQVIRTLPTSMHSMWKLKLEAARRKAYRLNPNT
jgi:glycosyltransferase involved in cell wall biosynthesis